MFCTPLCTEFVEQRSKRVGLGVSTEVLVTVTAVVAEAKDELSDSDMFECLW
jgi:hypothetical protein